MAAREALIVTTARYEDPRWNRLRGPGRDGMSLGEVLADPGIGGFTVDYVVDEPAHVIRRRVDAFLARRRTADELLIYFSCHGAKDDDGRLYLMGADTDYDRDLFESTAVSAAFLNGRLGNCRARSKALILDCCYSGAFDPQAKGLPTAGIAEHMRSAGTAVITATNELQLAWEEDGMSDLHAGASTASVFTSVLVEGLRTGVTPGADGQVTVVDLFDYVSDTMAKHGARQTPRLWLLGSECILVIARRPDTADSGTPRRSIMLPTPPPDGTPAPFDRAGQILAGITAAAQTAAATVGPMPRFAVVRNSAGTLRRTTDTVLALRQLTPATPLSGLGLDLARELVERMRTGSGDGAASAILVLEALLCGLRPALAEGTDPALLAKGMQTMVDSARSTLLPFVREVTTRLELEQVGATVTGDRRIGKMIAKAMEATGRDGILKVEQTADPDPGLCLVLHDDLQLPCVRLAPPSAGPGGTAETVALERPFVAVCDLPLSSALQLGQLRDLSAASGRPLVVFTRATAEEVTTDLSESAGEARTVLATIEPEALLDLGPWCGATIVRDPQALRHSGPEILGEAGTVTVAPQQVTLSDGKGDIAALSKRIDVIRDRIKQAPSQAERDHQRERLAQLFGGIAVIRVGAADEGVRSERASLVRVGAHACRAAADAGIVAGAASALAHTSRFFEAGFSTAPPHLKALAAAMAAALTAPLLAVAANCGEPRPADIVDELAERWPQSTYDAVSGSFQNTDAAEVWDPVSVQFDLLRAVCETARTYLAML